MARELAIWEAPHSFERGEPWPSPEWDRVFSYGLLLPEIALLMTDEGLERLGSRWGADEVQELEAALIPPPTERQRELGTRDTSLRGLAPFVRELGDAAGHGSPVPSAWEGSMKNFLDDVCRPDRFVWRWDRKQGRRVRVPRYDSLLERLSIEYDHLVSRRPRLSRCKLCNRVFAPLNASRPERYCRADLWLSVEPGDTRSRAEPSHLERCIALDEAERRRTRKRLEQRHRRLSQRHGPRHPSVLEAKRALGEWSKRNSSPTTGRQPRPQADVIAQNEKED